MEHSTVLGTTSVTYIPQLDPSPRYQPLPGHSDGGLPRILLPSGHTAVHLTRYADVHQVLTDPTFSRSAANAEDGPSFLPTPLAPELLIALDPPEHTRMRRVVTGEYSPGGVAQLRSVLDEVLDERLAALRAEDRPDLFRTVLDPLPVRVTCHFLGIPAADIDHFRAWSRTVQMALPDDVPTLVDHFTKVYGYLTELVTGARPTQPGGLVDRLVAGRDRTEPPLTDAELVGLLIGALVGGDQNALSVLTKAVYALLCAPELWRRLVDEPGIAPRLAEELIRLIPLGSISTFPRIATRDVELTGGAAVRAGDVVYADAFAANRDPEVFADPETIDPDRDGKRHLQFGFGMHHCMGAALSRIEITTVLTRLAHDFPRLSLAVDPAMLPWDHGILLRRPTSLPVRW
ncbi:cytochrome P450 [Streptomyces sp. NPDC002851]